MADQLSNEVVQHCQSTMTEKEAARTAVVSKTCYHAWATRARVDFNDQDYGPYIAEVATRMVTRYEAENLKLDSFRLWSAGIDHELAKNLIERALKLGAREIAIFVGDAPHGKFNLPTAVLGSDHITTLCAQGCVISLDEIKCFSLKCLHLAKVSVRGDLFNGFILKCHELVEVALGHTENLTRSVDLDDSWENLTAPVDLDDSWETDIGQSNLQTLELIGIDRWDNIVRSAVWSALPRLRELEVYDINNNLDWSGVDIRSRSLEALKLHPYDGLVTGAKFHVPNIRQFKFVSTNIAYLDHFEAGSGQWDCTLDFTCNDPTLAWFTQLRNTLKKLKVPVNLFLHIRITYENEPVFNFHTQAKNDLVGLKELRLFGLKEERFRSFVSAVRWYCDADIVFARGEVRPDLLRVLKHEN